MEPSLSDGLLKGNSFTRSIGASRRSLPS